MSKDILVIKPKDIMLSSGMLGNLRDQIQKQIPTGIVVIPEWCEVIKCPEVIEIRVENKEK